MQEVPLVFWQPLSSVISATSFATSSPNVAAISDGRGIRFVDRVVENRAEHGNEIAASCCSRHETRDFDQMIDIRLFCPALSALMAA